ncbi:Fumarylacetoacetate (FAA) hydrolase family protein [Paracoccus haematequi]|uniref:Fumarylacetoacetate (FAA) hydrolase family protein n=1 Tax=Paracoccus haematequi TaxID=2491866 RepID=A0A3S4GPX9_9RHOB|nr:AraD1 family protein [Paracoccus haematequi]VDS08075.1 Fumarylacetoacetate (FAA) hydrolase family protein [Paracoccus haematequi]
MFLSQLKSPGGDRAVAARTEDGAWIVPGARTARDLALAAIAAGRGLEAEVTARGRGEAVDLAGALADGRVLLPLDHDDPAHLHLTGTGLTHLGSAATRNSMHAKADAEALTDSMKMFRMGLEGGKPQGGAAGVQPEWFYKGNGVNAVAPGAPLVSPGFALDAGEEPEIAGLYLIGPDGTPFRLGFALANEFSDHVTERGNYLWLAHSKLRPASFGPEMLVGDLPQHVEGTSRILRNGAVIWEKPFLSGESNMSHSLANLEHHHFKYALFRQPGDVHVHFFGTATLSFADGVKAQAGDVFQIESPALGLPLANPLDQQPDGGTPVAVATL